MIYSIWGGVSAVIIGVAAALNMGAEEQGEFSCCVETSTRIGEDGGKYCVESLQAAGEACKQEGSAFRLTSACTVSGSVQ